MPQPNVLIIWHERIYKYILVRNRNNVKNAIKKIKNGIPINKMSVIFIAPSLVII